MKIRTDFVTNSSSSSFILSFDNEDTVVDQLKDGFGDIYSDKVIEQVVRDVMNAKRMTIDEAVELLKTYKYFDVMWRLKKRLQTYHGMTYEEARYYIDSDDGKAEIERIFNEEIEWFKSRIGDDKVIVEVAYADEGGAFFSDLEHHVMPNHPNTIERISHH